jgi:hypothetical protein
MNYRILFIGYSAFFLGDDKDLDCLDDAGNGLWAEGRNTTKVFVSDGLFVVFVMTAPLK